ncbi:MAG: hemolysin family protein [Planctomycetaceae bacterium]
MASPVFWELTAILLLIAANGFFSGAEIAMISANRNRLRELADGGDRRARLAFDLAQNPNRFLPTVQVGITLVGTFAAAFGGATLVRALEGSISQVKWAFIARHATECALAMVVAAITFVTVVLGELLPKRIALHNPTGMARLVARPIHLTAQIAQPLVWTLATATDGLSRLFGLGNAPAERISIQEIRHLIELGAAEGLVEPVEQKLAIEALQLGDRTVRQIMKPRIDIDALDVSTPQDVVLGAIAMAGFSRLPVYEGDLEHIIGFVHLKDVLRQHYLGWKLELRKLVRPALIVPDTTRLDQLLVRFQEEHNQLAIVVDEFGATRGMVTLEDVLEELVGELLTEHHARTEQLIVPRDATSWLVDGTVSIVDLLERLGRQQHLQQAPKSVSSVAGLVLAELGRIPNVGEKVDWRDLQLEVVDMDGRRIDRVLVTVKGP